MEYENDSLAHILKTVAMETLISLLKKIDGPKDLILSANLIGTLDLICGVASLKANGVGKIFKLQMGQSDYGSSQKRCFMIRPNLDDTKCVANHINAERQKSERTIEFWIIYVPRMTETCDVCLEHEGIYNHVNVLDYPLGLIPLDNHLLTLELNDFFVECFINNDQTSLNHIANSIDQLQRLFGQIPNVYCKGKYAKMICEMFENIDDKNRPANVQCPINSIILFDRDCDYASVLMSPFNYEALLDESFSIKCGKVELGPEVTKTGDKSLKISVHNNDPTFNDIRDLTFSSVFAVLKDKSKMIRHNIDKSQNNMKDLSSMKKFIETELKSLQSQRNSVTLHFSVCETIMERKKEIGFAENLRVERNIIEGIESKEIMNIIEESIIKRVSYLLSLRLIALLSYANDGLSNSVYKNLISLILQSYGHDNIVALFNLKKLGILRDNHMNSPNQITNTISNIGLANKITASASPNRRFRTMVKRLNLIPNIKEGVYDFQNPPDGGYVFGGAFIPVICRLIEILKVNKNANNDDILRMIPGDYICTQRNVNTVVSPETILLYFIGGVTYAEVSALRFIAKQKGLNILIAASSIINGNEFIRQLKPQM